MLGSGPGYGYGNGMTNQGGSPATWIHFNPLGPLDTAWIPCRSCYFLLSRYVICHMYFLFVFDFVFLVDNTFLRDDVVFDNDEDGDEG